MANEEFLSSLISDIKTYTGKDPLLPWLRGIRRMKDTLPLVTLNEKLPRFLQKCAQTFESDRRYRNDMRYLRVWLQLMDFVDDPRVLLRTMEVNHIGTKRCQFYQAYALYYEKIKRYDEAEKMYHLGVKNLAEPVDELQKSYEQFLHRMERKKNKRMQQQEGRAARRPLSAKDIPPHGNKTEENIEGSQIATSVTKVPVNDRHVETKRGECTRLSGDDTVVVKFVDTAIVGKSEAEDACHHGLVDPTINMKEAMNAINSMFCEPLEAVPVPRKSQRNRSKEDHSTQNGFEVFIDENLDNGIKQSSSSSLQHRTNTEQEPLQIYIDDEGRSETKEDHSTQNGFEVFVDENLDNGIKQSSSSSLQMQHRTDTDQEPLQIYIDDEGPSETNDANNEKDRNLAEDFTSSASHRTAFVFPRPKDLLSENSCDIDAESSRNLKFREDTVVCRFVGSTILDEPEVENVCHHGLVEPTINMKEAMDDINNMFGKPIDFVGRKRSRKQEKAPENNSRMEFSGFSILADDDLGHQQGPPPPKLSEKSTESDLFEPTLLTKEAMDDINQMFNIPLNY